MLFLALKKVSFEKNHSWYPHHPIKNIHSPQKFPIPTGGSPLPLNAIWKTLRFTKVVEWEIEYNYLQSV